MADAATIVPAIGLGGIASYLIQAAVAWVRGRDERAQKREETEAALDQHRDNLTFDLLKASREEIAAMRSEMSDYRAIQIRLLHFEEALNHLEELLTANGPEERTGAEKRARQFLTRMKRISDATGAFRNEAQILGERVTPDPTENLGALGAAIDRGIGNAK